jgi:RNA polymerase sigma-54 factor
MGIQQKLHTKLVQKLILTPSLQQAIKLLPMSTLELSDLLNQEMVENPMLEEVPTEELQPAEAAATPEKPEAEQQGNKTDTWDDQDYEYFFGDYLDDGYRPRAPQEVKELPPIENTLSAVSSLTDHLMWQLSMQSDDSVVRDIGAAIIGNLDDDGYLVASFDELAAMGPWPLDLLERALRLIQSFDPTGVAARDLQECLLLQIESINGKGGVAWQIIADHLKLVETRQFKEIARLLRRPQEHVQIALNLIRHLDPRPGLYYSDQGARQVEPDVYISKDGEDYLIQVSDDDVPQLRLNPQYRRMLDRNQEPDKEVRNYVKERYASAIQLMKNIEQRKQTILKVCQAIVRRQIEFLAHGLDQLKPMMIKEVAEEVGVHPSTVSRAVASKYAHTPQGVFELRYFFSEAVQGPSGGAMPLLILKRKVKKMIDEEGNFIM